MLACMRMVIYRKKCMRVMMYWKTNVTMVQQSTVLFYMLF